jgi:hypothetical protein
MNKQQVQKNPIEQFNILNNKKSNCNILGLYLKHGLIGN